MTPTTQETAEQVKAVNGFLGTLWTQGQMVTAAIVTVVLLEWLGVLPSIRAALDVYTAGVKAEAKARGYVLEGGP